jgi:hypothetical protein
MSGTPPDLGAAKLPPLPRSKFDMAAARALADIGYPAIAPLLPRLLEWVQDENWPVAMTLLPFLQTIGLPLAPHLRLILKTDDEPWKGIVIRNLVAPTSPLRDALRDELERLAFHPTPGEREEALDEEARSVLDTDEP